MGQNTSKAPRFSGLEAVAILKALESLQTDFRAAAGCWRELNTFPSCWLWLPSCWLSFKAPLFSIGLQVLEKLTRNLGMHHKRERLIDSAVDLTEQAQCCWPFSTANWPRQGEYSPTYIVGQAMVHWPGMPAGRSVVHPYHGV